LAPLQLLVGPAGPPALAGRGHAPEVQAPDLP